ncbi:MAG: D-amino acid aminotransferase [Gemmatimonadaceae bacterium]|nr:D-amino acid aminotransferase [Gemmatimonadaceae bacterium]
MSSIVYLNGEYLPRGEAKLSVDERGFFFGDGVYEVTRAVDGRLFESGRHMTRLARGLRELRLEPSISLAEIEAVSLELLKRNDITSGEGTVYLQITRGAAPRTHHFPPAGTPCTVFLSAQRFSLPTEKRSNGIAVVTYPDIRWSRCDIKTVNLLAAVMAKQHAVDHGVFEAIFVRESAVTEGSHTNVFGVIDGELRTYPSSNLILPGITRDVVLEVARELGMAVNETPFHLHHLPQLQEAFLTGTTTDVMPIVSIDGAPVGDGKPGKVSMALYDALAARIYGAVPAGGR